MYAYPCIEFGRGCACFIFCCSHGFVHAAILAQCVSQTGQVWFSFLHTQPTLERWPLLEIPFLFEDPAGVGARAARR